MLIDLATFACLFAFIFGWYLAIRSTNTAQAVVGILAMFTPAFALFWLVYFL